MTAELISSGPVTTTVVTMPIPLGTHVLAALRVSMLAGPVVAERGAGRWGFLTTGAHQVPKKVAAELAVLGVRTTERTVADDADWVHRPTSNDGSLPPWTAVIATARSVVARSTPVLRAA